MSDYLRIEQAIQFLERNFRRQPELKDIARHVHLSEHHFHRLFRRWAGISPKRFLQFLTVEHAKRLLQESKSLLDVTYESGLSSPGRLHDLFVATEAMTPGEFKQKGAGLHITYGFHLSPFGECLLAVTERGICGLAFVSDEGRSRVVAHLKRGWPGATFTENSKLTASYIEQIFPRSEQNGIRKLSLFLKGTNFQIKVWEALLRIPPGAVLSYEDLAVSLGKPRASRAVGNAVADNPIAFIIPCHRIIRKMGVLGNYRWGPARKKAMLGWEAARENGE